MPETFVVNDSRVVYKPWGNAKRLITDELFHVEMANIRPGGFCSIHKHVCHENRFIVVSGRLSVLVWTKGLDATPRLVKLNSTSDTFTVLACLWHQFVSEDGCRVIEYYRRQATKQGQLIFAEEEITRLTPHGGLDVNYARKRLASVEAGVPVSVGVDWTDI